MHDYESPYSSPRQGRLLRLLASSKQAVDKLLEGLVADQPDPLRGILDEVSNSQGEEQTGLASEASVPQPGLATNVASSADRRVRPLNTSYQDAYDILWLRQNNPSADEIAYGPRTYPPQTEH